MGKIERYIAWICTLTAVCARVNGKISPNALYAALSEDIQNELRAHTYKLMEEFHESVMGERLHQIYDFSVIISANHLHCYYEEAENRTTITINYASVQTPAFTSSTNVYAAVVLSGGNNRVLASKDEDKSGEFEFEVEEEGTYAFCFKNRDKRNAMKFQIQIDIWRHAQRHRFIANGEGEKNIMYKAKRRVFQVSRLTSLIRHAIRHTHSIMRYDYLTVISNQSRVNNFSIMSMVLIAVVCFIQIHFVKKMFGNPRVNV